MTSQNTSHNAAAPKEPAGQAQSATQAAAGRPSSPSQPAAQSMTLEQKIQHRNQVITRTGTVGIIANVGLALAKAVIGLIANSLPIILDAVNSATDALSSIVTIIGVKLAGKPADKEHPMGYGRVEYLSALLVATAVFATGIITMRDSILKVIHPELAHYDAVAVIVIVLSIVMKIWLGLYTRKRGRETQSEALDASGVDALFDAVVTGATLVGMFITMIWHITLDGWISAFISAVVIKSGWDMLANIINEILGERIDPTLAKEVRQEVESFKPVIGAHDLYLDSYGPNSMIGSIHLEVPAQLTAQEIDKLSRAISKEVFDKHHIILTCGIYGADPNDPQWRAFNQSIRDEVMRHPGALSMHALYVDHDKRHVTLDVVRDFGVTNVGEFRQQIIDDLTRLHPQYTYTVHVDVDYAE